jgi:hypothetical protein
MKKIISIVFLLQLLFSSYAQNVGIGTTIPQPTALLELNSISKGFLTPRMTIQQIRLIQNPAEGLMVYNLTFHKPCYFNGTRWNNFDNTSMELEIGQNYEGGIIVYLDNTGLHGLIAAASDQSTINSTPWGCEGVYINGAVGISLGTGLANTTAIVNGCASLNTAARICFNLVLNGYSDWYLPSKDEAALLCTAKQYLNLGGGLYYTSSQYDASAAWYFSQSSCSFNGGDRTKSFLMTVRAVRTF